MTWATIRGFLRVRRAIGVRCPIREPPIERLLPSLTSAALPDAEERRDAFDGVAESSRAWLGLRAVSSRWLSRAWVAWFVVEAALRAVPMVGGPGE